MKKIIINSIIFLALVVLVAFVLKSNKEEMKQNVKLAQIEPDFIPVNTEPLTKRKIVKSFKVNGNLIPNKEVTVSSEMPGVIKAILIEDGVYVKSNQILARLDDQTIKATLDLAKANFDKIEKDKKRIENLFEAGGISQQDLDNIQLAHIKAKTDLISAEKAYNDTFIRAPFSGINDKRYIEKGSYVRGGDPLFDIVDVERMKMEVMVSENEIQQVELGMSVTITIQALGINQIEGTVSKIGVRSSQALTFPVEIKITNASKNLKSGMFGTAHFNFQSVDALAINRSVLVGSIKNPQVYIYQDSTAVLKNIDVGQRNDNYLEVVSGLNEGDLVITSGQINLVDGAKIRIKK
ncbi:efflux RND transporter periplasmic adaptor subunit [Fulvivirga kasyanovii]|uniref:Efflux RND transporter periplasmic adaptor subunit n=1 Tax=Fulvivirga kasyanovii TaxID=396812 RepID=A0ABW9RLB7_9BACT|nr:efflux RND transporter periplasmic adaptor subunit [Fulvivirga kasyanovii]MTI24893.1 efflux RND transporter periplasmic adaptor subunit [Fulvivirga kasyanovii]